MNGSIVFGKLFVVHLDPYSLQGKVKVVTKKIKLNLKFIHLNMLQYFRKVI